MKTSIYTAWVFSETESPHRIEIRSQDGGHVLDVGPGDRGKWLSDDEAYKLGLKLVELSGFTSDEAP